MRQNDWIYCTAVGQDSHRFMTPAERASQPERPLVLGGLKIPDEMPLAGNSDADVLLHALTNALSGLTTRNILGRRADRLCLDQGITDSAVYLREALADLASGHWELVHISLSVEAARPRLADWLEPIRDRLAGLTGLRAGQIGLTATSGEGLSAFGRGDGMMVICLVSARRPDLV
ncbi:MAG: 2-C-methyl-D-erythritol 2,4-cyclodiphosphate synthase [Clostridiaceae bacterium]|jgi:2-C-methyl-D-erythritol 2,4-cyclodiphosphate synthase|nr:2-C-methyl-D-erythritol 2,4-cyclodiphosphate synthase [Clostridiaceae bacterium]